MTRTAVAPRDDAPPPAAKEGASAAAFRSSFTQTAATADPHAAVAVAPPAFVSHLHRLDMHAVGAALYPGLWHALRKQLEYYFSRENLSRDSYLCRWCPDQHALTHSCRLADG